MPLNNTNNKLSRPTNRASQIFLDLYAKLEKTQPQQAAALLRGAIPNTEDSSVAAAEAGAADAPLLNDPIAKAIDSYKAYCAQLHAEFTAIVTAYQSYQKDGLGLRGYNNRYWLDRAYGNMFLSSEGQVFADLIDAITLIDGRGTWIEDFAQRLASWQDFDYEQQRSALDHCYDFFTQVKTQQEQSMTQRKAQMQADLLTQYRQSFENLSLMDVSVTGSGDVDVEANNDPTRALINNTSDSVRLHTLIDHAFKAPLESNERAHLNQHPKLAHDLEYLSNTWRQHGDTIDADLATLKKKIHRVAQALGLPQRIVDRQHCDNDTEIHSGPGTAADHTQPTQKVTNGDTNAWISCHTVQPANLSPTLLTEDEVSQQNWHWRYKCLSRISGGLVGFGEGFVAVTGLDGKFAFLPLWSVMVGVGLPGCYINYLLFNGDIRACLNNFHKLLLNDDGSDVSPWQSRIIKTLGLTCLFVGLVYGALNFTSTRLEVGKLATSLLGYPSPLIDIGVAIIAACTGSAVFLGFSAIYFKTIANGIKNNELQQLGQYLTQLCYHSAWSDMTLNEKGHQIYDATRQLAIMALAISCTLSVLYYSYDILYRDTRDLIAMLPHASRLAPLVATVATVANVIVSTPFQTKGPYEVFNNCIASKKTFVTEPSTTEAVSVESPLQISNRRIEDFKIALAVLSGLLNGTGQAFLYQDTSTPAAEIYSSIGTGVTSFGPNVQAAFAKIDGQHRHLSGTYTPATPSIQAITTTQAQWTRWAELNGSEQASLTSSRN